MKNPENKKGLASSMLIISLSMVGIIFNIQVIRHSRAQQELFAGRQNSLLAYRPTAIKEASEKIPIFIRGEACDGVDNDDDGLIDEEFDLENDISNCGACNYDCNDHGLDEGFTLNIDEPRICHHGRCTVPFESMVCTHVGEKLVSEVSNFPPASLPMPEVCDDVDNPCDLTDQLLANEQNPHIEHTKVLWGICHILEKLDFSYKMIDNNILLHCRFLESQQAGP